LPELRRYVTALSARERCYWLEYLQLIDTQNKHEAEWFTGRVELQKKHAARPQGRVKADRIIAALTGVTQPAATTDSKIELAEKEKDKKELLEYDKKVHKAQSQMVEAFCQELEAIGIPFFGIKKELIAQRDLEGQVDGMDEKKDRDRETGKIHEKDLLVLRGRVIETLQDLAAE
jgi:hypothetical protein